jgi:hypothetical protein
MQKPNRKLLKKNKSVDAYIVHEPCFLQIESPINGRL